MSIEERNPEKLAVLQAVKRVLDFAEKSGTRGFIDFERLQYHNGHFGDWNEPACHPKLALSQSNR